jgi:hypothetical protein
MALLRLSGVGISGTPPRYSSMRMWDAIRSGSVYVQLASAYVYLLAPIEAMKICAGRISPVTALTNVTGHSGIVTGDSGP